MLEREGIVTIVANAITIATSSVLLVDVGQFTATISAFLADVGQGIIRVTVAILLAIAEQPDDIRAHDAARACEGAASSLFCQFPPVAPLELPQTNKTQRELTAFFLFKPLGKSAGKLLQVAK